MNKRPTLKAMFAAVLLVLVTSPSLLAQRAMGFQVVVSPQNQVTALSKKQLSDYFLKKTATWSNGEKVLVVDQNVDSSARQVFSREVHGKPVSAVKAYWTQRIFSGRTVPPLEMPSDAAVVSYVVAHPGAIGYVSTMASVDRAKVLTITD